MMNKIKELEWKIHNYKIAGLPTADLERELEYMQAFKELYEMKGS